MVSRFDEYTQETAGAGEAVTGKARGCQRAIKQTSTEENMGDGARAVESFIKEHLMTATTDVRLALDLIAEPDHGVNQWRVLRPRLSIDTVKIKR